MSVIYSLSSVIYVNLSFIYGNMSAVYVCLSDFCSMMSGIYADLSADYVKEASVYSPNGHQMFLTWSASRRYSSPSPCSGSAQSREWP